MSISKERVDELRAIHGRVEHVKSADRMPDPSDATKTIPCWEVVYRKPNRNEFKAFMAAGGQGDPAGAQEMHAKLTMVEPSDPLAKDALLEEWPGIPLASDEALKKLAGLTSEKLAK